MKNPSETSPLLKRICASLQKRKSQMDEMPPVDEMAPTDETNMEIPEERHEVDILVDMQKVCERMEDEECRAELKKLIDEMGALHAVDVEELEETTEPIEEAIDEKPVEGGPEEDNQD